MILPTYNGATRVAAAIESVQKQTYCNWELLVVNDGSTDDTWDVISAFESANVHALQMLANGGPTAATNHGVEASRGQLIAFIDDDDTWLPEKLQRQVDFLNANPKIGLVHAGIQDVYPDGVHLLRLPPRDADSYRAILTRDRFATSTVMVRRNVLDDVGLFDPSLRSSGDWELWTRIARKYKTAGINELLAEATHHDASITMGNPLRLARDRATVMRRHWQELRARGLAREAIAQHHHYVGGLLLVVGHQSAARKRAVRSLRMRPTARGAVLLFLTCLSPSQAQVCWRWLQALRRALRA